MHTVVVGNGIIGLAVAYGVMKKSSDGDKISVIGPVSRDGSATQAAGGMLNSFAEVEAGSLDTEPDLFRFEMSRLATNLWPEFEAELSEFSGDTSHVGWQGKLTNNSVSNGSVQGTYVVNNTAADDLDDENFDAILAALMRFNEPHVIVTPKDIPGYQPAQRARATRAVLINNEGWYNPKVVVQRIENALANSPIVHFVDDNVTKLHSVSGKIERVDLKTGGVVEGDNFVLCNGASLTELLNQSALGLTVQPVFYGVGASVELRAPKGHFQPNCIRTPNRGLACGIYSIPYFKDHIDLEERIVLGASNFVSEKPLMYARLSSVEAIMKAGMNQIHEDFYRAELVGVNVGWRPQSADTYPLIGKSELENLFIVSGTKRDGFHLSPIISQIMSAMIVGEAFDSRILQFAPGRKLIRSLTRDEAINKAIRHMVSAAFQHEFNPSPGRMSETLVQAYRDDLERIHDKVGASDWGIPVDMIEMYRHGHIV